jgi:CMP-N-acetylneuraminic acid synthetase
MLRESLESDQSIMNSTTNDSIKDIHIACIYARGGSKGLPGKNIRDFAGKPLIAWAIEQALELETVKEVIVSTDSIEIAETSRSYGASVPFIRPSELAMDDTPEWMSWRHMLDFLLERDGELPEAMLSLPTTAPLRAVSDIQRCLDAFELGVTDAVVTVTDSHRSPYFNMVKLDSFGYAAVVVPNNIGISRRQDAPSVFDMTTAAYVVDTQFIRNHNGIFEGRVKAVHLPIERSIDIDTLFDFEIAEFIHSRRKAILP